jgi:hypothetical protein
LSTRTFCWQPIATVPFFYKLSGHLDELLPFLTPVLGKYQVSFERLQCALNEENTRLFEWTIERDETQNIWKAIPFDKIQLQEEAWECADTCSLVTQIEFSSVLRLFYNLDKSFFGLHSAFLTKENKGLLIIGPKEAGKSTLSCALWQKGWRLHADDFTLIDDEFSPHPNPRRVSLRYSSRELLGEKLWHKVLNTPSLYKGYNGLLFHPSDLDSINATQANPYQLSAIIFLARPESKAGSAELQKIIPANAIFSFLPYSTLLVSNETASYSPSNSNWGEKLPKLAALVEKVPIYDLGRGPLDHMIERIENIIE